MFPGLTRSEACRENGKGARNVAGVSGVDPFGSTEGIRLRDWARVAGVSGVSGVDPFRSM